MATSSRLGTRPSTRHPEAAPSLQPTTSQLMESVWCYREVQYHFLSPDKEHIEKFVCPVCLSIVHNPVQTSCGHLFCLQCFEGIRLKEAEAATVANSPRVNRPRPMLKCPACMGVLEGEPVRDKFNEREVRNFRVKCPYNEKGCTWEGYLPEVEKHLRMDVSSSCQFQLLPCKRCGVKVERRHLSKHLKKDCEMRESRCPHCRARGTYKWVTLEHHPVCDYVPQDCPNGCGAMGIPQKEVPLHLAACTLQPVPCRYKSLGCSTVVTRCEMEQHLAECKDTHLEVGLDVMKEVVSEMESLKSSLKTLQMNMGTMLETLAEKDIHVPLGGTLPPPLGHPWLQQSPFPRIVPCILKVDDFPLGLVPSEKFSDAFYTRPRGYKLRLRVEQKVLFTSVLVVSLHPSRDEGNYSLQWPISGTVTITLLNQLANENHYTRKVKFEILTPNDTQYQCQAWERPFVNSTDLGIDEEQSRQLLKEGLLYFRVDCVDFD